MSSPTYTILGLGRPRSLWFTSLTSWANSGALPASVTKCVSVGEVRQRLNSLQTFSVLLIEDSLLLSDVGLIEAAKVADVPVIVIGATSQDERVAAHLPFDFSPSLLLNTLASNARVLSADVENVSAIVEEFASWRGKLITVCGPGGTGASTTAMAIAQGLGARNLDGGSVLLADLTRNTELAMLHDLTVSRTCIEDVIELHRVRKPDSDEIRSKAIGLADRGYYLLPGVLKQSSWASMSMMAIDNTLAGLQRSFLHVVADVTADFEGEEVAGSIDIEERNALARMAATDSDLVVAVGHASTKGVHSLSRTIRELLALGVDAERIMPVVTLAPKSPLMKSEINRALAVLADSDELAGAVFANVDPDPSVRDGIALPKKHAASMAASVEAFLTRLRDSRRSEPEPIALGSIGDWEEAV